VGEALLVEDSTDGIDFLEVVHHLVEVVHHPNVLHLHFGWVIFLWLPQPFQQLIELLLQLNKSSVGPRLSFDSHCLQLDFLLVSLERLHVSKELGKVDKLPAYREQLFIVFQVVTLCQVGQQPVTFGSTSCRGLGAYRLLRTCLAFALFLCLFLFLVLG
jgi:hypothetical protein